VWCGVGFGVGCVLCGGGGVGGGGGGGGGMRVGSERQKERERKRVKAEHSVIGGKGGGETVTRVRSDYSITFGRGRKDKQPLVLGHHVTKIVERTAPVIACGCSSAVLQAATTAVHVPTAVFATAHCILLLQLCCVLRKYSWNLDTAVVERGVGV